MGIARGTNIVTDGLIYGYDTGYGVADVNTPTRFYPGETTENLIYDMGGTVTSSYPEVVYICTAQETNVVDATAPGGSYSRFTGNTNDSNNQLYSRFSTFSINVAGDSINYSVWLKGSGTCHLTIYDNSSGYRTSPTITLTTEWTRYNYTATVNASATTYWVAVRGVTSSTNVYVSGQQAIRNTHATPYVENNRSATQGLIDLKRTINIDISNVSFDSTGQPDFDGTDDRIVSSTAINLSSYTSVTYEGVVKAVGFASHDRWFSATNSGDSNFHNPDLSIGTDGQLLYYFGSIGTNAWIVPSGLTIDTTKFNHLVYTFTNAGVAKIYINGIQQHTATYSGSHTFPSSSKFMAGMRFDNNGEGVDGSIPIVKVYSKALTADEVTQNYKAYKNRFNL